MRLLTLTALCAWWPGIAFAQDAGLDAHGLVLPALDGDPRDPLLLQRPGRFEQWSWFAGGVFEYAEKPLVRITEAAERDVEVALDDLVALDFSGGVAVHERVRLDLTVPLYLGSLGLDEVKQGVGIGDIRLAGMVAAIRPDEDPSGVDGGGFGLGFVPYLDLPTGDPSAFLGQRSVAGGITAAASYELRRLTFTGNVGLQFNPKVERDNLNGADALQWGLGAGYLVDAHTGFSLEGRLATPVAKNDRAGTGSPGEITLSGRHHAKNGAFLAGGVAVGFTPGIGAAVYRVMLGGGFGRFSEPAPKDYDLDGLVGDDDLCPRDPETVNGYLDSDGCPDQLAEIAVKVTFDGARRPDATLDITGADTRHVTAGEQDLVLQVPPDLVWELRATDGDCLAAERKVLAPAGHTDVELALERIASSVVRVSVRDEAGEPVPSAVVKWEGDKPECLPTAQPELDAEAKATYRLGPGKHQVVAQADGYRLAEVPVLLSQGEETNLLIELKRTKIKVEKKRIVILEKVQFEYNKAVIKADSFELLNEVGTIIRRNPQAGRVEVAGHTDSDGPDKYNLELSQRRADAVKAYLMAQGTDPARLIAKGYGESEPLVSNATKKGKATNRRVEFQLIDQNDDVIEESVPPGK